MATIEQVSFGALLRTYRCEATLTQQELATCTGLSSSTISKLERDVEQPRRHTIGNIATALALTPSDATRLRASARLGQHPIDSLSIGDKPSAVGHRAPTTSLVGREREVEDICALLADPRVRLLTLSGPGGVGKTRLALRVLEEMRGILPSAMLVVGLAEARSEADVVGALARALALPNAGPRSVYERLVAHLRGRDVLVLLDNFEHLLPTAPRVAELLSQSPRLRVLVTSRARLRVSGEHDVAVSPLAVPSREAVAGGPAAVGSYSAVRLFVERMRSVRPGFDVTADNASAIADVCRRLDGLPLAIELAAARGGLLGPAALLERLGRRFDLLTTGPLDAPSRLQTLRAALAWSYGLLDADEQAVFRALSVFHDGGGLDAVSTICAGVGGEQKILDSITSLFDKSLVQIYENVDGEVRIGMLETIREYGRLCLTANGENDAVYDRHARYFEALAEEAYDAIYRADADAWLGRLARDHDNLQGALAWLIDRGEVRRALRLAGALYRFWLRQGYLELGLRRLDFLLAQPDAEHPSPARARALLGAGALNGERSDLTAAAARFAEAIDIYGALGDADGEAGAMANQGAVAFMRGAYAQAQSLLESAIAHWRTSSNINIGTLGRALGMLGNVAWGQGRYEAARGYLEEGLALARSSGHTREICSTVVDLGGVAVDEGDYACAKRTLDDAFTMAREHGYQVLIAIALTEQARLALKQGDPARAVALSEEALNSAWQDGEMYYGNQGVLTLADGLRAQGRGTEAHARYGEALAMGRRLGSSVQINHALHGLAALVVRDNPERAVRLWGAATRAGDGAWRWSTEDTYIESTRAALGTERFAALWDEGAAVAMGDDEIDVSAMTKEGAI